jgi:NAD(P)-dependent dehydrogenase (short-subunit alcohol dehydrogenase family)
MLKIKNKVIVITGGAGLLGSAFAKEIVAEGGTVIIGDLRMDAATEVANDINKRFDGNLANPIELDITSKKSIQKAIEVIDSNFGKIDALVNNAYPKNKNYGRKFEDVQYEDFCENLNIHLGGYFLTIQTFAQYFKKQQYGNIITVSSIYGVIAPRFEIYNGLDMTMPVEYAVIKSALINLNRYLLRYFDGDNIRFNCLSPGGIFDNQPEQFVQNYSKFTQSKKMLVPDDVVGTLLFLLSDYSKYINGQNLIIDDGWS